METKILPAIGHIKLDGKPGGYNTRVIKYQHSAISSILQTGVYWQVVNDNIACEVQPPKGSESKKDENYFDEVQIKNFLEYVLENELLIFQALAFVDVTYHGLRHTSATLLIAQGLDIKTVSARLGHSETATTLNIYTHTIKSKDKIASEALENLLDISSKK